MRIGGKFNSVVIINNLNYANADGKWSSSHILPNLGNVDDLTAGRKFHEGVATA